MSNNKKRDYEVGYGKPPKEHQFKKGQSGGGRRKGTKNLRTDLREELSEKVTITEGGKKVRVSKQRLIAKALIAKGCKGNVPATNTLVKYMLTLNITGLEETTENEQLTVDEHTLLEILEARVEKSKKRASGQNNDEGGDNEDQ